jgi:hypothetical protein
MCKEKKISTHKLRRNRRLNLLFTFHDMPSQAEGGGSTQSLNRKAVMEAVESGFGKVLIVTDMQIIITKIGCRIGQSCKIRRNVLVCTSVREPSRGRNSTNNKMGRGLLATTTELGTLRGCVAGGEAQLTYDVLLKRPVRRPLSRTRGPFILLPVALLPIGGSRGMEATKINLCWWLWRFLWGR